MNRRMYVVTALAVFGLMAALGWLLDQVVLSGLYELHQSIWRDQASQESLYPLMFLKYMVVSFIFVWLFIRGYRNKGWAEGVRFGLVFGFVIAFVSAIDKFFLFEVSVQLALGWFMGHLFQFMIAGLLTAVVYHENHRD